MSQQIYQWLQSIGLEKYYQAFQQQNITDEQFIQLTIQQYQNFGITQMPEKQKLFRLISNIKSQLMQQQSQQPVQQQMQQQVQQPMQQQYQQPIQQQPVQQLQQQDISQCDPRGIPTQHYSVLPPPDAFQESISHPIRVVVRKRPLNQTEIERGYSDIISTDSYSQMTVHEKKVKVDLTPYVAKHTFLFDQTFNEYATNDELFAFVGKPVCHKVLSGGNGAIFAYGQTGSGKSFTISREGDGLIWQCSQFLLQQLQQKNQQMAISYYEIYGNRLYDLLNNRNEVRALEDAKGDLVIAGLVETPIQSYQQMEQLIQQALTLRRTNATSQNSDSSRSHAILELKCIRVPQQGKKKAQMSKLQLVDLAGAERAADVANNARNVRQEGAVINLSLLALKNVFQGISQNDRHLVWRQSKMTLCLRSAFEIGGVAVMICCVTGGSQAAEQTLNSLRYSAALSNAVPTEDIQTKGSANSKNKAAQKNVFGHNQRSNKQQVNKAAANKADLNLNGLGGDMRDGKRVHTKFEVLEPEQCLAQILFEQQGVQVEQPQQQQQQFVQQQQLVQQQQMQQQMQIQQQQQLQQQLQQQQQQQFIQPYDNITPHAEELLASHVDMVNKIYELTDQIIVQHRQQVDLMMQAVKEEVQLLHNVESQQISVDDWANGVEQLLLKKQSAIQQLLQQLQQYKQNLAEEQKLSDSWRLKQ